MPIKCEPPYDAFYSSKLDDLRTDKELSHDIGVARPLTPIPINQLMKARVAHYSSI